MSDVVDVIRRTETTAMAFCATSTAGDIMRIAERCQSKGQMAAIVGEPGVGKTTALREYRRTRTWSVTIATMAPAFSRSTWVLRRIASEIGAVATTAQQARAAILQWIENVRFARPLLIIDEAQFLLAEALEDLRAIHDETGVGIVFSGNPMFLSLNRAQQAALVTFTSRIATRLVLAKSTVDDVNALCDHQSVSGQKARAILGRAAHRHGNLRAVSRLIDTARDLAGGQRALELNHIREAAEIAGIEA